MAEEEQRGKGTARRRPSTRRDFDPIPLPVPKDVATLQERRLMSGKPKRPARWRGPQNNAGALSTTWPKHTAPAVQSHRATRSIRADTPTSESHPPKSQNVELRFSFSATPDESPSPRGREETVTRSFSGLCMTGSANRSVSANPPQTRASSAQEPRRHSESIPQAPQLEKPKKKREGYGFSYSETFMFDSDDYPDTECEWEPDEPPSHPKADSPADANPYLNWDRTEQISRPASRDSTATVEDQSFNDLVVLRDVGSFHLARPQRILPCTPATREDTLRLKVQAKTLVSKYEESADIQAQLLTRLERMMYLQQQQQRRASTPSDTNAMATCAEKLRDFLLRVKEERVETGEHSTIVEHELEWVTWLVQASKTGVMHVRTEGCTCRPDWDPE
ncbi:uncharacterized protein SETTUDRAFT_148052 [Exserohilum turcica Et28A]|uniref:Uncharacterized protein n=1 Tax=Exserohilum turcicum (strain 28A) TaxID=671987 RepID=R0KNM2_EXST2|nr:uncharacterized protein SETTUDRAFT_148052 [Exserohilum turcica Et28A]EOA89512.1 hypothetical protein SETTUDRAFT_148052 [Exserohilum turcica Et28A]